MRTLIANAILVCTLFSPQSNAQRGVSPGGGAPGFRPPAHPGVWPSLPFERLDGNRRPMLGFRRERGGYVQPGYSSWGFPASYGDFGQSNGYDERQAPQIIVVVPQPEAPPPPPPPPPDPPRAVIHDYNWPAADNAAASAFSLVSTDGKVRFAIAVWLQGGILHYIAVDHTVAQLRLDTIDREATHRLNAQGGLTLRLLDAGTSE